MHHVCIIRLVLFNRNIIFNVFVHHRLLEYSVRLVRRSIDSIPNLILFISTEILRLSHFRKSLRVDRIQHVHFNVSLSLISHIISSLESNPCASSPCQHQGVCVTKSNQNIQCICRPHYTGKFCEYPGKSLMNRENSISNLFSVPFRLPIANRKCNRICYNGGICLVKTIC